MALFDGMRGMGRLFQGAAAVQSILEPGLLERADLRQQVRHVCYSASWKKLERVWDLAIRARQLTLARPMLEALLAPR